MPLINFPLPHPYDSLIAPVNTEFEMVLWNLENDLDWNTANANYIGHDPLTFLRTGNVAVQGLDPNSVYQHFFSTNNSTI